MRTKAEVSNVNIGTALNSDHPFALAHRAKSSAFIASLNQLTNIHYDGCSEYRRLIDLLHGGIRDVQRLEDLPFIPVRLFKHYELKSVAETELVKTLTSSGTSGQSVSRIYLDRATAAAQTQALIAIVSNFIGKQRLPMLIIDSKAAIANRARVSARAAGILGFSIFGRDVTYALNDDMEIDFCAIDAFVERHSTGPVLIFGFTSIIWQHLVLALEAQRRTLSLAGGILIHGGGWKKLQSEAVSPDEFKARVNNQTGVARIHNYYGMIEQTGSIFMECQSGFFHASDYSEVQIRNPLDFGLVGMGQSGLIQLFSLLPRSYPGHSILTEDLGELIGRDDCPCGRLGSRFRVLGRVKDAETRGCSDTYTVTR